MLLRRWLGIGGWAYLPGRGVGLNLGSSPLGTSLVPDWTRATRDTSLRCAVISFELQGYHPRGGGGVIFPEDLDWGR